jgi:hypothetical protein
LVRTNEPLPRAETNCDGENKLGVRQIVTDLSLCLARDQRLWRSDMALEGHLVELSEKHRALDRKIEEELARPLADPIKVAELKRQKLRLKDEIEKLKHEPSH